MGRRGVVARVLHRFGSFGVFKRDAEGVFDPTTSTVSGEITTEFGAKGTLQSFKSEEIDGTEVLRSDMKYLVPAKDFDHPTTSAVLYVPQRGDRVTITKTNQEFLVQHVRLLDADKAYLIQLRGGGQALIEEAS